ncbi:MAG: hypothetical protein IRZ16_20915 [Myxococcaceae bacterium]|nr:hypothetical protein [Myxococcaceae bacterium]
MAKANGKGRRAGRTKTTGSIRVRRSGAARQVSIPERADVRALREQIAQDVHRGEEIRRAIVERIDRALALSSASGRRRNARARRQ